MRRSQLGWLGGSLLVVAAVGASGACGSSVSTAAAGTTGGASTAAASGSSGASSSGASSSSSSGGGPAGDSVLMHHKNPSRDGVYTEPALTRAAAAGLAEDASFKAEGVQGAVYAQPLFVDGGATGKSLVIVATEADNVYALDAATGAQVWKANLGAPVPLAKMPCGNIDPMGITGTPVIDLASRTLFLHAMTTPDGGTTKKPLVFALSVDTGAVLPGWPVDVGALVKSGGTSFDVSHHGQRGALLVADGTLYVSYGGLYGDCLPYHGWMVAIPVATPTQLRAWATPALGGAAWAPGGIASDGTNVFIATGNTFAANIWGGGDAVIRFGMGAAFGAPNAYFAPKNWVALDNADLDLGTAPVVFDLPGSAPDKLVIVFGKDGKAYLLDRNNLGGVSDPLATIHAASDEIISAPVVYTTATGTYVAFKGPGATCTSGSGDLTALRILPGSPPTFAHAWCGKGGTGSPMVTTSDGHADAIVWTLGAELDGRLHGFDGDTGEALSFPGGAVSMAGLRRYNTPIAAKGRIFVPVDDGVIAFKP